jgi:hypothetical protein
MQITTHDLANQSPWCAVSKRARPWILGALALSLLLAGHRVTRPESSEVGLELNTPGGVARAGGTGLDVIGLPHTGYLPRHNLSAVIARYFDTYLPPEEFQLDAQSNRYTAGDNDDSHWWSC